MHKFETESLFSLPFSLSSLAPLPLPYSFARVSMAACLLPALSRK